MCKECEDVVVVIDEGLNTISNEYYISNKMYIYNIDEGIFAFVKESDDEPYPYQGLQIFYCPFCGEKLTAERCIKNLEGLNELYRKRQIEEYSEEIKELKQCLDDIDNKEMEVLLDKNECLEKIEKLKTKLGELNV